MEFRENDNDSKEIQITQYNIKIPLYYKDEKYLISIYPSHDNINIIFKLEKDKIQTYYFFEKFDLRDFRQKSKIFLDDKNISDVFIKLKDISNTYFINLEIKGIKISIIFKNINTNAVFKFALKKKLVSQERLNPVLVEQIQDNKSKLTILRNQVNKLDKNIQIKNDIINNINSNITNINNILNNITIINTNNNSILNSVSTKNSSSNESNSENNSNHNNEDEYQEAMNESNNPNSNTQTQKNDSNKNNNNKSNINDNNTNNNNNKNSDNLLETFFCFEKNDPAQNKKIIELLIIFNVVTIIIVLYILSSVYNFRIDLNPDGIDENEDEYEDNKLTYLAFIRNQGNNNQNFRDVFEENLDLLNKGDDGITSSSSKEEYLDKKKKKNKERYDYYSSNLY